MNVWAALLTMIAAACGAAAPVNPGTLAAPSILGEDVILRQRIFVRRDGSTEIESFDCVLQKRGDSLVVVVLTPFGTRAFSVEQRGGQARVDGSGSRAPAVPPRWILLDIQRALAVPGHMVADGPHRERRGDETIEERWRGGRLLERRHVRGDQEHAVVIRYEGGMIPPVPPRRIHYRNPWGRYSLLIVTLERTVL